MNSDAKMPFVSRSVSQVLLSREQAEGMGARVRRSIGRYELRNLDPFLMLDEFKVAPPAGFPDHPHRGFETVTYMLPWTKGIFCHEDFAGHKGTIGAGDLQWMTAGKGIVHSEMPADPKSTDSSHGLQLWVNLARQHKLVEPAYQELKAKDIPHVKKDGVTAIVIAGLALGVESPVYTRTPVHYLHFQMEPNSALHQPIPPDWNSFAYTLQGDAYFADADKPIGPHHTVVLAPRPGAAGVSVSTRDSPANFVLISGQPLNEPVVQHGPFVMTTPEEIQQAFNDYSLGRNGFERAPGWHSEIGRTLLGDD